MFITEIKIKGLFWKNIKNELNNTLPPNLLCTKGIYNQERKVFSVSGR